MGLLVIPLVSFSQDTKEDEMEDQLGVVTDAFQEHFFEALKQKGIENYDRAIKSLELAAKESPHEVAVYFELAKNHSHLKQWTQAENQYHNVLKMQPNKTEAFEGLYDVYYQTNQYQKAIEVVQYLIPFDKDYKEDLANLYERTEQFEKALQVLDELDIEQGNNEYRNQLRQQIYLKSKNTTSPIYDLEQRIKRTPINEQDFLNLIYLYSEENNSKAAFETAKKLISINPKADLAHLALYKFYLEEGKILESIESIKKIAISNQIDIQSKWRVINDFLNFVNNNPEYEDDLEQMVNLFSKENNAHEIYERLAEFYSVKNQWEKALYNYKKALILHPANFSIIKNVLLLQIETKKFDEALELSTLSLELFPSQPLLYLIQGMSLLIKNQADKAIAILETGLDYVIDNPKLERDFYIQLSEAYSIMGNQKKSTDFLNKSKSIIIN